MSEKLIVIGTPSYNEEDRISGVAKAADKGLLDGALSRHNPRTFSRLACLVHLREPFERLCLASAWYTWVFLYDDRVDPAEQDVDATALERIQERHLAVFEKGPARAPDGDDPLVRAFANIWAHARTRMPPV